MTAGPVVTARRSAAFHALQVAEVAPLTDTAVTITFDVPPALREAYAFLPGQHLTVRAVVGGEQVRRSYSICVPPSAGRLTVAVKLLDGGVFSTHAHGMLAAGDVVDVMPPAGRFGVPLDPSRARRYAAIVAGSGITPVMSILPAVLDSEPGSSVTLVYGNRDSRSVMFADELADLKDRYPARLQIVHVLSREPHDAALLHGRIDDDKLTTLLRSVVPPGRVDEWLLCGPYALVEQVRARLQEASVPAGRIHRELFHVDGEQPRLARPVPAGGASRCEVTARLDGRSTTFAMPDEGSVLDAVLTVRADAPFACKGGVCGTCRVRVVSGSVTMARHYALDDDEVEAGFALACQAVPTGSELTVDFDA